MNTQPYNKSASRQGSFVHEQVIAPVRGAACKDMTREYWHTYFIYEPATGNLIWKSRPLEHFAYEQAYLMWNTRYAGKIAGAVKSLNEHGHRSVSVDRKPVLIHRVIWEMHNSPIPDRMKIDHIDGDATNNRIENLRLATNAQNSMNSRMQKNNTSGFKGVSFRKDSGKWRASIAKGGKQITIGAFSTPEKAHAAYKEAAIKLHGEFARFE